MRRAAKVSAPKRMAEPGAGVEATEARYLGSIEHKAYASPAGEPRPRHDASKCPRLPDERWADLTAALQMAIGLGCFSEAIDAGGFPRYVWGWFEGRLYEARHLSTPADAYKAYPIEAFELPEGCWERLREGGAR